MGTERPLLALDRSEVVSAGGNEGPREGDNLAGVVVRVLVLKQSLLLERYRQLFDMKRRGRREAVGEGQGRRGFRVLGASKFTRVN